MHIFKEGKYTKEQVKNDSVKRTSSRIVESIDTIAGKKEPKVIKCSSMSKVSHYSKNQPIQHHVHSIQKANTTDCCKCHIALFLWPDGFFYLDHSTTNLIHNGHPQYPPDVTLKGIKYINTQSNLLIECMSAVGVHPTQLSTLLEMLNDSDGTHQSSTVKNLLQKCELIHHKELGIVNTMSSSEKAMDFLNRYVVIKSYS